ncbi:hypothetical protein [Streptomyces sp. NPDC001914]|uniref:hypothetical protein n=1 Tax=Streptomyces sp. NPDC001914 TaxID=3364623 RepID=UPI0036A75804
MTSLRWGLALSGWVTLMVVTLLPDALVLRGVVATAFLLVCPGLAASRWARPGAARVRDRTVLLETGVLTPTLSVSIAVLVVEPLFLLDAFGVTRALLALAAVTSVLALLPRHDGRLRRAPRAAPDTGSRTADNGGSAPADTDRPEPADSSLPQPVDTGRSEHGNTSRSEPGNTGGSQPVDNGRSQPPAPE